LGSASDVFVWIARMMNGGRDQASGGRNYKAGGCKFNMQYICETSSGDHRFYRNNDDQVE
jgi:hypothetical protein